MKYFWIIFLIFLLPQCKNKTVDVNDLIHIQVSPEDKDYTNNMSVLFDIHKYIPLETSDSCLIGEITKIIVADSCFWILDQLSNTVFCFDYNGKLKFKIDKAGRGPQEYSEIDNFAYGDKILYVFNANSKILQYDSKGNFIKENRTSIIASDFDKIGKDQFAFFSNYILNDYLKSNAFNILITNSSFKIKDKHLPFPPSINPQTIVRKPRNFSTFGNSIIAWQSYDNKIYKIQNGILKPKYVVDFGVKNKNIENEILKKLVSENVSTTQIYDFERSMGYCNFIDVLETNKYLLIIYNQINYYHYAFYEKSSGKILELSKEMSDQSPSFPIINDIDGVMFYFFYTADQDYVYGTVHPYELLNSSINNPSIEEVKSRIKENDNPIITLFTLKDLQ